MNTQDMNKQEMFDYSVDMLAKQGERCVKTSGGLCCAYGNNRNLHCGIGWLLDHNNPDLMSFMGGVVSLIREFGEVVPLAIRTYPKAFKTLQSFHDAKSKSKRKMNLKKLSGFGINVDNPNAQKWIELGTKD
ncbi:hypothetical protein GD1_199 [Paraglaciecola Antarctic GD virus 1]|nr:hypothetical protein GD1_199 [Paraglaciecola Antarctic GD virus 1]